MIFTFHRVDERVVLMIALFVIAFGYFTMLPMTSDPPQVALTSKPCYNIDYAFEGTCYRCLFFMKIIVMNLYLPPVGLVVNYSCLFCTSIVYKLKTLIV